MAYEHEGSGGREQPPGVQLARLLRQWWEGAGNAPGGVRPTQQALAHRVGVDQTTLSRYLNPKHTSNAPPRVVEALHAQLCAPAAELERARALCRAALAESNRQRGAGGRQATVADGSADGTGAGDGPGPTIRRGTAPATGAGPAPGTAEADAADAAGTSGTPRFGRALPALMVAAVILAFVAGAGVRELVAPSHDVTAAGAAGALPVSEEPPRWPLLRMKKEDQYTRCRALQHLLNAHGYEIRADGFFGEETRDAVMHFQRGRDLSPDGKVGDDTWPELVKTAGSGAQGPHVLALQELLNNVGQGGTVVSGRFTAVTAEDLRHFQRTHGLPVTGRTDTETWLALLVAQLPPVKAPAYQRATSLPPPTSA
ncbi:peptidoglycan-binding protein [Streptomyces sp. AC627_RSS907]|uniref:peptidoglycan-binding protein n=1 Tax=Streptomyces sp. AC627_RSS907 TaxID=2823684 RepID=UPI001C221934|nr:peptidoglycan-binding protein [Streptomyces sp. AC627_RSS907]